MATLCSRGDITGFPFANVFSVSDGPRRDREASGVPYLFLTPLDMSVKDLQASDVPDNVNEIY